MKTSMARFPFHKTLESFDFKFQPSIDPKVVREPTWGRQDAPGGGPGPEGSCAAGYRTAFATTTALVTTLTRAHQEGRLEEKAEAAHPAEIYW
jgi:DNA replication protein DnaC